MVRSILLVFTCGLLFASPAAAKDRPTVLIVGLHDATLDIEAQQAAAGRLAEALEADKRLDALGPDDLARALAGREDLVLADAWLASGRRLLEDGRILHDQAQPEDAIAVLEQATQSLGEATKAADATRELWEAYLYLGAARFQTKKGKGESKEATAAWQAAVALAPERLPDQARIPPNIVAAFRAVQDAARAKPITLSVTVDGEAMVQLNDRAPVPAPARFEGLTAGTVHLRVKGKDGRFGVASTTLASGTPNQEAKVTLGPPQLPSGGGTAIARARTMSDLYRSIGKQAKPNLVLIAGGTQGNGILQVYAPAADVFGKPIEFPVEGGADDEILAAIPKLLATIRDDGSLPTDGVGPSATGLDPSTNALLGKLLLDPQPVAPIVEKGPKWWQIAAGGAGAVVVGGTITAAAILGGGDGDRGTIIVGPVP